MIRKTSREAYATVLPDLNEKQAVVLGLLQGSVPLTNSEIAQQLGWTINRVTPRVLELRGLGKLVDMGKRTCRITQRTAHQLGVPKPALF